jgi:hypothetical protein
MAFAVINYCNIEYTLIDQAIIGEYTYLSIVFNIMPPIC